MHVHIMPLLAFLHMYVCLYVCNQSNQNQIKIKYLYIHYNDFFGRYTVGVHKLISNPVYRIRKNRKENDGSFLLLSQSLVITHPCVRHECR